MAASSAGASFAGASSPTRSPVFSPQRLHVNLSNQKLSKQTKQLVCNVYAHVRESQPGLSVVATCRLVSQIAGVSERTVQRIKSEALRGSLTSPKRKRLRFPKRDGAPSVKTGRTRLQRYDSFTLAALRRKVHRYFERNEVPTAAKLLSDVVGDPDMNIPNMSVRTLRRLLNDIGFQFRKRKRNCALLERDDIIVWRRKYLRTIREMRRQKRPIYYLDETWVNAGHTREAVWQDTAVVSREDAFRRGLSTGLRAPSGKGGRLIVVHAGSKKGFVNGACLVFKAKKGVGDYHCEMDGTVFETWFKEQFLPHIEPQSVIVMDNASYHSVQLEKVPCTSTRKSEIQSWLTEKNIPFSFDQLKAELLQLVNQHRHRFSGYRVDTFAKAAGHDVVRLPPYHCEFNPIELVWSQVKGYVAAKNTTFTLASVEKLVHEGIALVTAENWSRDCLHVERLEEEAWERDGAIDVHLDDIIISLNSESDTSSQASDSDMAMIDELE